MGLFTYLLENMIGRLQFCIYIEDRIAAELTLNNKKEIIIDVKNPSFAIEIGIETFLKKRGSGTLKKIKKLGYNIKIKYKGFEFEI